MKINRKALAVGLLLGGILAIRAFAKTADQIWQAVYDSSNTAIRVNQVAGS